MPSCHSLITLASMPNIGNYLGRSYKQEQEKTRGIETSYTQDKVISPSPKSYMTFSAKGTIKYMC